MNTPHNKLNRVFVTGGAGYVGSILIPKLLEQGHEVVVLDRYFFGHQGLELVRGHKGLTEVEGDIRDTNLLEKIIPGCDAVIHLACMANDPSFELNPELSKTINFDCFEPLVKISKKHGVKRFVYASTSSVYGVSDAPEVDEEHPLLPITDYNKYKGLCEPILHKEGSEDFTTVVIRPATVCGYGPRQRLDLTVNILTNHAIHNRKITVFGGSQKRPNIHIEDITDLYLQLLKEPKEKIQGQTYNAGWENHTVADIAKMVKKAVQEVKPELGEIAIVTTPSDDIRSYHISSRKLREHLGFTPKHTIEDAVRDLVKAIDAGKLPESMTATHYSNIKTMQELDTLGKVGT